MIQTAINTPNIVKFHLFLIKPSGDRKVFKRYDSEYDLEEIM